MKKPLVICFGEVLWDNLLDGRRIGGAPLNVCYHLSKYGVESKIISQIGDDDNGKEIASELGKLKINTQYCFQTPNHPTSTVEVKLLPGNKIDYEIVEDVAWDYIPYTDKIGEEIERSAAFVFGSLASRNSTSRESLFKCISKANWVVFDSNLRAPFYSQQLIEKLITLCQTLKINDDELTIVAAWLGDSSIVESRNIETIFGRFSMLEEIILTKGAKGASHYSRQEVLHVDALKIHVNDTVGSGDSFLAAFVANKLLGHSLSYCMKEAISLSAFVATSPGACPVYDKSDVSKFRGLIENQNRNYESD